MKNIDDMTLEEIESELEKLSPKNEINLLHIKKFLTSCSRSSGFLHAGVSKCSHGIDGFFILADCSRQISLELIPDRYAIHDLDDLEQEYTSKVEKIDMIIDTLEQMRRIVLDSKEDEQHYRILMDTKIERLEQDEEQP